MAAGGVLQGERAAMDVLASVGRRSWNHNSGEHLTIHSAVYNLTNKPLTGCPMRIMMIPRRGSRLRCDPQK